MLEEHQDVISTFDDTTGYDLKNSSHETWSSQGRFEFDLEWFHQLTEEKLFLSLITTKHNRISRGVVSGSAGTPTHLFILGRIHRLITDEWSTFEENYFCRQIDSSAQRTGGTEYHDQPAAIATLDHLSFLRSQPRVMVGNATGNSLCQYLTETGRAVAQLVDQSGSSLGYLSRDLFLSICEDQTGRILLDGDLDAREVIIDRLFRNCLCQPLRSLLALSLRGTEYQDCFILSHIGSD